MNKNDLAYLAGFIDGEGSISVDRYTRTTKTINYGIKISITNSNLSVLEWVQGEYGGYIATFKKKKENHHTCYQLTLRYRKAYRLISEIKPFLKLKLEIAVVAMRMSERAQIKYDHKQPKTIERQSADSEDYSLIKTLITNYSNRNINSKLTGKRWWKDTPRWPNSTVRLKNMNGTPLSLWTPKAKAGRTRRYSISAPARTANTG
jgi:hypothetical protein